MVELQSASLNLTLCDLMLLFYVLLLLWELLRVHILLTLQKKLESEQTQPVVDMIRAWMRTEVSMGDSRTAAPVSERSGCRWVVISVRGRQLLCMLGFVLNRVRARLGAG